MAPSTTPPGDAGSGDRPGPRTAAVTDPRSLGEALSAARRAAGRGARDDAEDLIRRVAADVSVTSPARWRVAAVDQLIRLDRGETDGDWSGVVAGALAAATDDPSWGPDLVADAADVAFHRSLQFDSPDSPLAADPSGFLEPFRASPLIGAALARPRTPRRSRYDLPGFDAVLVSQGNLNFAAGVRAALDDEFDSVGDLDLTRFPDEFPPDSHRLIADVIAGRQSAWQPATDLLMGSSRLVWAEWAQRQAVVPSHALPDGPRLVVRLHAYEIFTALAQFIDWRRVDELVVVSAMMRNAVRALLPLPDGLPVTVVGNHVDPGDFTDEKGPGARHTLAMVGHNSAVKDPDFALDVLDAVLTHQPEARLLLIGSTITETSRAQGPAAAGYTRDFLRRVEPYLASGHVRITGETDDVAGALRDVGFILSTSRRESFHQGLIEGALSGAVPVTRDWPIMAPFGGPASFLPDRWVARTPAEFADRVVPLMTDDAAWAEERRRCRAEAATVVGSADAAALHEVLAPA